VRGQRPLQPINEALRGERSVGHLERAAQEGAGSLDAAVDQPLEPFEVVGRLAHQRTVKLAARL